MKSKSAVSRTLGERLSALMVVSALIVAPAACAQSTPDSKTEQQAATKSDPAATPADAAATATAAAPAAEPKATPANPCAPKAKKKPSNPCE